MGFFRGLLICGVGIAIGAASVVAIRSGGQSAQGTKGARTITPLDGLMYARLAAGFDDTLRALEAGVITQGKPIPNSVGDAFGVYAVALERTAENGDTFVVLAFIKDQQVLLVYTHRRNVFAAQHLSGRGEQSERWFFCDTKLLAEYVDLAIKIPDPMEHFLKNNPNIKRERVSP